MNRRPSRRSSSLPRAAGRCAIKPRSAGILCDSKNMEFEAKTEYSSALVTQAAWKFWMKKYRKDAVLSIIVMIVALYFFLVQGNKHWVVEFMLAVATIYVGAVYGGFLACRRHGGESLKRSNT